MEMEKNMPAVKIWSIITYAKSKGIRPEILNQLTLYNVVSDGIVKVNPGIMPKDGKIFYRVPTENQEFMERFGNELEGLIEEYDVITDLDADDMKQEFSLAERNYDLIYTHYVPSIVSLEDVKSLNMYEIVSNGDGTYNLVSNAGRTGKYDDKLLAYDVSNHPDMLEKYANVVGPNGEKVIITIPIQKVYASEPKIKDSEKRL